LAHSFIYLVMVKIKISSFQVIILPIGYLCIGGTQIPYEIFLPGIPYLDCTYRCTSLFGAKKRYVYMVQSGIMNYKWQCSRGKDHGKRGNLSIH
jgi:uncharacterized C2H2 Zn-finger protein